jgi:hypothetical protein
MVDVNTVPTKILLKLQLFFIHLICILQYVRSGKIPIHQLSVANTWHRENKLCAYSVSG